MISSTWFAIELVRTSRSSFRGADGSSLGMPRKTCRKRGVKRWLRRGETVLGSDRVALRTMPREAIVPYGGAAPIDVYVGARDAAILCVVMATWTDQSAVMPAFELGFAGVDRFIEDELTKRGKPDSVRKRKTGAPAAPGSSPGRQSKRPPPAAPSSSAGSRTKTLQPPSRGERKTMLGVDDPALAALKVARSETPIPKAPGSKSGKGGRGRTQRPPPFALAPRGRTQRPPANGAPPPPTPSSNSSSRERRTDRTRNTSIHAR